MAAAAFIAAASMAAASMAEAGEAAGMAGLAWRRLGLAARRLGRRLGRGLLELRLGLGRRLGLGLGSGLGDRGRDRAHRGRDRFAARIWRRTRLLGEAARLDGERPLFWPAAREHLHVSLIWRPVAHAGRHIPGRGVVSQNFLSPST